MLAQLPCKDAAMALARSPAVGTRVRYRQEVGDRDPAVAVRDEASKRGILCTTVGYVLCQPCRRSWTCRAGSIFRHRHHPAHLSEPSLLVNPYITCVCTVEYKSADRGMFGPCILPSTRSLNPIDLRPPSADRGGEGEPPYPPNQPTYIRTSIPEVTGGVW
jgi:hypothetical protein